MDIRGTASFVPYPEQYITTSFPQSFDGNGPRTLPFLILIIRLQHFLLNQRTALSHSFASFFP